MNEEVMKALVLLMQSTIDKARKKGFDIMLLLGGITVLAWWNVQTEAKVDAREIKWEAKFERANAEYLTALNETNRRLQECERDKYDLSIRVAVLEFADRIRKKQKR